MLWLLIGGLVILFAGLFLFSTTLRQARVPLSTELAVLQLTLENTPAPRPEEEALRAILLDLMGRTSMIEEIQPTLQDSHIDWPTSMATISNYDPTLMSLTGISEDGTQVILNGQADDESIVMAYVQRLRDSAMFGRVTVQSITLQDLPLPTAVPTYTPQPTYTPEIVPTELQALITPYPTFTPLPTWTPTDEPQRTFANFIVVIDLPMVITPETP